LQVGHLGSLLTNTMNILIPPAAVGVESWSSLGSSFEGDDPNIVFSFSINSTPAVVAKDAMVETAVADTNNKIMVKEVKEDPSRAEGDRSRRQLAADKLARLYRDPKFGPEYFRQNAQLLKQLMMVYRTCKTSPNLDMFYHKGSKTGIHIHFNSVTRKKQIVIPLGSPDKDPVRINISDLISWYKAQRRKALTARLKALLEIAELNLALAKANEALNVARSSMGNISHQFERRPGWVTNPRAGEIKTEFKELLQKTNELAKLHEDRGMYVIKDFLKLVLEVTRSVTNKFWSVSGLIKEVFEE